MSHTQTRYFLQVCVCGCSMDGMWLSCISISTKQANSTIVQKINGLDYQNGTVVGLTDRTTSFSPDYELERNPTLNQMTKYRQYVFCVLVHAVLYNPVS